MGFLPQFLYILSSMSQLTQQQLLEIFHVLKQELKPYEQGNVKARIDIEGTMN